MAEPQNNIDNPNAAASAKGALPHVPSPSISPAEDAHKAVAAEEPVPATNALTLFIERAKEVPKAGAKFKFPNFTFTLPDLAVTIPHIKVSRRTKRRAAMAASLMLAASLGGLTGALAIHNLNAEPKIATAAIEETQALHESVAHLSRELGTLKASLDSAAKSASTQISKVTDRIARIEQSDVTGSITKPATVAAIVPAPVETPLPVARPAVAPVVLQGWTARAARNGAMLVESRGEVYEVSPGVPLPGLGTVESIKRDGDRWVVSTPKGIIVSSNAVTPPPARQRPYYPPYYYRPF